MKRRFVNLCGVPTEVVCFGSDFDNCNSQEIILVIPGMYGNLGYYLPFLEALWSDLQFGAVPLWAIAHGGHTTPTAPDCLPDAREQPQLYTEEGLVLQKLAFVRQHVPAGCRLHLVSYSAGTPQALQLDSALSEQGAACRVASMTHLLPLLYTLSDGLYARHALTAGFTERYHAWGALVAQWLPERVMRWLLRLYLGSGSTEAAVDACLNLLHPATIRALTVSYRDVCSLSRQHQVALLARGRDRTAVLLARNDRYLPQSRADDLVSRVPDLDVTFLEDSVHDFVLYPSAVMKVSRFVVERLKHVCGSTGESETLEIPAAGNSAGEIIAGSCDAI